MSITLAVLLLAPAAAAASSASSSAPPAEAQAFFTCQVGFTLETATQPGSPGPQRLAGVRCSRRTAQPPVCAAGTVLTVVAGPDACLPGRTTTAAVTDGTSNTVMLGETAPPPAPAPTIGAIVDGTSNTIAISETAALRCRLSGERLSIDSQRNRDECIRTEVRAPTQPVTLGPRG